jgi:PKD repeat protein
MCVTYANGTGTPAYQWYSNTVNSTSNGTAVSGAMASCYTPPSATAGTTYYYAVINLSGGGCSSITSNTAAVVISPDPVIATQPTPNQTICVGGSSAPLTVSLQATTGIGAFTYQWYANTTATNSGGTVISGASSLTYNTPAFNTAGTFYYYCVVTDAGNGCGSTTSQVATVVVVADPTATISPGASYCQNAGTVVALSVVVSNGQGTPSYQWYSNTVNSNVGGTAISGATAISYSPSVAAAGTTYYYCMISQSGTNCSVNSPTAQIIVTPAPTFTIQPVSTQSVCVGVTTTQLSVAYSNGTGAPSYQWYSNTSNMYNGGVPISAATSSAYTPPSSSAGATYYYCVVSFSAAGGCSLINSNIAQVIVDPSLCGGITAQAEFSMAAQGCNPVAVTPVNTSILNPICGDVTYQWNIAPSFAQFVSGTNSSSLNPVIQFTLPGNYTVSLTLNSCGTITTVSHQILVETAPAVSIASASSCSPYSYMPGVNVAQADIISNTPVNSFSWSVNPNVQVTNSNSANPTIQFNQSGIYTIGLQVSNICGTDTDQAQIEIFGDAISYYQDTDNDSFGNSNIEIISCVQPAGYVANNLDCNDANASINPSALEVVGNGIDENCDGENTIFSYGILDSTPIVSCNDESVVIAVSTEPFGLPNYGLQWYFKTGNIASPAGSSTIGWNMISGATSTTLGVAPFIGTRTYACFVTPDASYGISGEWMVGAKVLTYNSFTAQTIIGNPNITPFNSYNYIVNPISGHTYSWSVTNGAIASGQGTNNVSIMWGQNGPYQVTLNESDGTCSGSSVLFAVNNNCNLTVSAASATTTSFCSGASVQLQAATTATNITYQWYLNGVAIAGETNQNTAATLGGNYQVSITQNGCSAISQVLAITELPGVTTPILVVEQTNAGCSGNDATVSLTDANYNSITWSNGTVNASSINVSESGSYSVTVTDNNGCTATSSAVEINLSLVDVVPICLVTVDQTTGKNNVVWEPVTSDMINSYVVLKETNVANVYAQIGTVAYGSNGLFEDVNSNPQVQANRYKLALIDTCGILSSNSDYHKTIHLTTNLGVGNNVNLIWSGYEGFDFGSYNIYRGASAGTMTLLTTIASNLDSYSDINPPVGEVYYMIEVEGVSCDPQRTLVYSHSNILDTSVGVEEVVSSTISLYPNPATTSINLQVNSTLIGQEYVVFDAIGKVIYKSKIQSTNEIIQLENFNNGNYFVKVNEVVKRIVVQH